MSDVISGTTIKAAIDRVEQHAPRRLLATLPCRSQRRNPPPDRTPRRRRHDALILLIERGSAADPDAKVPQPLVNVVIDWETFTKALRELAGAEPEYDTDSTCELLNGTPITPQQATELALLGHVARIVIGADNTPINAGRSRRLYTQRMKAILAVRDRHCTWPGCDMPPHRCETDHIHEWHQGGPTNIANARLTCRYHHRQYRKPAG